MDGAFHSEFPLFGISGPWVDEHPAVHAFGELHRPVLASSVDYNYLIGEQPAGLNCFGYSNFVILSNDDSRYRVTARAAKHAFH
ncbi:hypothetical protein D3C81_2105530 [compost metagenome]